MRIARVMLLSTLALLMATTVLAHGEPTRLSAGIRVATLSSCSVQGSATSPSGSGPLAVSKGCTLEYTGSRLIVAGTADGTQGSGCPVDDPIAAFLCRALETVAPKAPAYLTLTVTLSWGPSSAPVIFATCRASGYGTTPGFDFLGPNVVCRNSTVRPAPPPGVPMNCTVKVTSPNAEKISGGGYCMSIRAVPSRRV